MYQRRIVDTQHRQRERWEDTPEAQAYERWVAGWKRRVNILKWATGIFAAQLVVWLILAWNDSSLAPVVFASWFIPAGYALYISVWSFKEMR